MRNNGETCKAKPCAYNAIRLFCTGMALVLFWKKGSSKKNAICLYTDDNNEELHVFVEARVNLSSPLPLQQWNYRLPRISQSSTALDRGLGIYFHLCRRFRLRINKASETHYLLREASTSVPTMTFQAYPNLPISSQHGKATRYHLYVT